MEVILFHILGKLGPTAFIVIIKALYTGVLSSRKKNWNKVLEAVLWVAICQETTDAGIRNKIYRRLKDHIYRFDELGDQESKRVGSLFIGQLVKDIPAWNYYMHEQSRNGSHMPLDSEQLGQLLGQTFANDSIYRNVLLQVQGDCYRFGVVENEKQVYNKITPLLLIDQTDKKWKSEIYFLHAQCCVMRMEFPESIEFYIKAYDSDPSNQLYKHYASWAYFRKKELDEAKMLAAEMIGDNKYRDVFYSIELASGSINYLEGISMLNGSRKGLERYVLRSRGFVTDLTLYDDEISQGVLSLKEYDLVFDDSICHQLQLLTNRAINSLSQLFRGYFFSPFALVFPDEDKAKELSKLLGDWIEKLKKTELFKIIEMLSSVKRLIDAHFHADDESLAQLYYDAKAGFFTEFSVKVISNILLQNRKFDEALELVEQGREKDLCYHIIRTELHFHNREFVKITESLPEISELCAKDNQASYVLGILYRLRSVMSISELEGCYALIRKHFANGEFNPAVQLILGGLEGGEVKEDVINEVVHSANYYLDNCELSLTGMICETLMEMEKISAVLSYLGKIENEALYANRSLFELKIYAIRESGKDLRSLLPLFEVYRNLYSLNKRLLSIEIEILQKYKDWPTMQKLIEYGLSIESENIELLTWKLKCHNLLGEKADGALIERIRRISMNGKTQIKVELILHLAEALNDQGENQLAIELLFPFVRDKSDFNAIRMYNAIFLMGGELFSSNCLSQIEKGVFVELELVESGELIDKWVIPGIEHYESYLKKSVGEIFRVVDSKGDAYNIKVIRILNAFAYEAKELISNIKGNPLNDLGLTSLNVDTTSSETLLEGFKNAIKQHGLNEDSKNYSVEYFLRKIGFIELVTHGFRGNPFYAYSYLQSEKNGVLVLPRLLYEVNKMGPFDKYVLDMCTVIMLSLNDVQLERGKDYFVAPAIREIFVDLKTELEKSINIDSISLSLINGDLVNIRYTQEEKRLELGAYEKILVWLNRNVIIKKTDAALDIEGQLDHRPSTVFTEYLVETLSFFVNSKEYCLVSDDLLLNKMLSTDSGFVVSSEILMSELGLNGGVMEKCGLLGVSITASSVKDEFVKSQNDDENIFDYCKRNLSFERTGNILNFETTFNFLEALISLGFEKELVEKQIVSMIANLGRIDNDILEYCESNLKSRVEHYEGYFDLINGELKKLTSQFP